VKEKDAHFLNARPICRGEDLPGVFIDRVHALWPKRVDVNVERRARGTEFFA
jgi:hypothetical protein